MCDCVAIQSTSPVFMKPHNGQCKYNGNMPDNTECLESQVLRFRAPSEKAHSPQSPVPDCSKILPAYRDQEQSVPPMQSMERALLTSSTDRVRQESPECGQSTLHQEKSTIRTESPMSNPMRTPSSMGESTAGLGKALPGLSPVHALPMSAPELSPAGKGGSPLVLNIGRLGAVDNALNMVPTRTRTPDCFLDRMKGASSDLDDDHRAGDAHSKGEDAQPPAEPANGYQKQSLVPNLHNPADAPLSASLAALHQGQPDYPVEPPCLAQSPEIPGEENDGCKPGLRGTGSGGRRLHIPADVSGSKDDSDHDSSRAWHRSLGMSHVQDSHTAPFSVLPHRPASSRERPVLAQSQDTNDSHAEKELIGLHGTAAAPLVAVRESSRSPPVLASHNSLIDADVPLTAAREHPSTPEQISKHAVEQGQAPDIEPAAATVQHQQEQVSCEENKAANMPALLLDIQDQDGCIPQLASPQRPTLKPGVYPDVAACPGVDPVGPVPSAQAQAVAKEVRRFCAMAEKQAEVAPGMGEDRMQGQNRSKPLVVPVAPDLQTARRAHRAGKMTASQERVRASMGRKRATILAGHFGRSYAAKAQVLAQGQGGIGGGSYAALAARARQRRA